MRKRCAAVSGKTACLVLGILCVLPKALAGNVFEIDHHVMSGGGGISSGGNFTLQASVAQIITATSNGGAFQLQGGFWHEALTSGDQIFKNGFE